MSPRRGRFGLSVPGEGRVGAFALVLPVALIVLASLALVVALPLIVAQTQDRSTVAATESTVAAQLRAERRALGRLAKDHAWRDRTIDAILAAPDARRADEAIGADLADAFGVSAAVVVGGAGRPVYAWVAGKRSAGFDLGRFGPGLADLLRAARASLGSDEPEPATAMVAFDGTIHFAAASLIVPETRRGGGTTPDPMAVLVLLRPFDDAYLSRLAAEQDLAGLRVASGAGGEAGPGVTLKDPGGGVVGRATWDRRLSGLDAVADAWPLIVACLVVIAGALGVFLVRVRRIADRAARDHAGLAERTAAMERTERYLDALLASTPAVLFALDADGTITLYRGRGLSALGIGGDTAAGRPAAEVFGRWPEMVRACRSALGSEPVSAIIDADDRHLHLACSPIDDAGDGAGMVGIVHDVTDRVAAEKALRQTQKLEALGELAGSIAHEMNNLLQPILGLTELAILDLPPGGRERERLERVATATIRATDLVKQILDFSRAEPGVREPVALDDALSGVLDLARSTMPATVKLEVRLDDGCIVTADRQQLGTVLLNLVANARDAVQDGGGTITVSCGRADGVPGSILPAGSRADGYAVLRVSDDGAGIPPAIRARVFEPFFTTKTVGRGTGLGLATVHSIVESHGGSVHVLSEPGRGSTFEAYLPLATARHGPPADVGAGAPPAAAETGQGGAPWRES